jgi:cell division protein FtsB
MAAAILADGMVGDSGLLAVLRAGRDFRALAIQIDQLRAQNKSLRETARRLREDPATIESLARRELGLMRPGEKVFIIRDAAPQPRAKS